MELLKIKEIRVKNFKCFNDLKLGLGGLTLLAGQNGSGKSSVIQALLLLRQSFFANKQCTTLALNGDLVSIGSAEDARYEYSQEENIAIGLTYDDDKTVDHEFKYDDSHKKFSLQSPAEPDHNSAIYDYKKDSFYHVGADRLGPRKINYAAMGDTTINRIGSAGEYAVELFLEHKTKKIAKQMCHKDIDSAILDSQLSAWLGEVSPGVGQHVAKYQDMDIVNLKFSYADEDAQLSSNKYRATSVGFGITYVLPVLVALLLSRQGHMVIIENPEAHLHPQGQVAIGGLAARAAAVGAQVIIETHSDHVLNGVRLAVHDGIAKSDDVAIYSFRRVAREGSMHAEVDSLKIFSNGRIDSWPEGFFDEYDKSLDRLLQPGSSK